MNAGESVVGSVVALWRYPVKSMQGEELNAVEVTDRGLLGDRAYALLDADQKVVSAKNPRKWPGFFDYRASWTEPPQRGALPPVRITLPDGAMLRSDDAEHDARLSAALGRQVQLCQAGPAVPILEEYWPDIEGLPHREHVTDEKIPAGAFFDSATVHLMTTATLDRLRTLYPAGRFEVRRFRPNIVIGCPDTATGFVEQEWIGKTLHLGDQVQLKVTGPCPRCVMITLPQADLPGDHGILRSAVQHAQGHVGIYASVIRGGLLRRGAPIRVV